MKKVFFFLVLFSFVFLKAQPADIRAGINAVLAEIPVTTDYAILIIDPISNDTLYAYNIFTPLIPASNTKLFTTAAAVYYLGYDYRLSTKVLSTDANISDGVVNGDLYIAGFGNALFTSTDLSDIVITLQSKGINTVTGNIYGDDSFFDNVYMMEDWYDTKTGKWDVAPISALSMDGNETTKKVKYRRRWVTTTVNIDNPPLFVSTAFYNALTAQGISVYGSSSYGTAPYGATVITEHSVSLKDFIKPLNKHSDNFLAESLFKIIGAVVSTEQGSSYNAATAVMDFLSYCNIFVPGTHIVDGSGLSRKNRIPAAALVKLLEYMFVDLRLYEDYSNSLTIAGVDGTLHKRMQNTVAEGNFHGKTGTLRGVTSLSGYFTSMSGKDLIISMLFEYKDKGADYYRDLQDEIIAFVAANY